MKINIPEIGTEMVLSKDWNFTFLYKWRNEKFFELNFPGYSFVSFADVDYIVKEEINSLIEIDCFRLELGTYQEILGNYMRNYPNDFLRFEDVNSLTLPVGTYLKVDRVYIRKGAKDFSSVTFWCQKPGYKKKYRFFAKLEDVNNIEYN